MEKAHILAAIVLTFLVIAINYSTALAVKSVDSPELYPGQSGEIRIEVENTLDKKIEDVSLSLNFQGIPISSPGGSEDVIDELSRDEDDAFIFKVRVSSTATPQDYNIPYTLLYRGQEKPRAGFISLRVLGNIDLSATASPETPVLGHRDELTLKIINKGFADARYVTVKLFPIGYNLYSDDTVYIGDISSDDFETAVFNVKYNSEEPAIEALIEYLDFNNQKQSMIFRQNLKIYTEKEAVKEGIIGKNNAFAYVLSFIILIVLFIAWRSVRKRIRMNKSRQKELSS